MVVRHVAGDQLNNILLDIDAREIDRRHIQHPAHAHRQILVADILLVLVDEEFYQARAFLFLALQKLLDLRGAQKPVLDQGVGDTFGK